MLPDADVIVVGAAVAGCAVANALGSHGISTLVLEKGAERDNSTRGDILHPSTLRFLERWGLLDALHADGSLPIEHLAVSHRTLGRLATYPVAPQGDGPAGRSVAVPHDRIEAVMKAGAEQKPSVRVERARVVGLVHEDGRVAGVRTAERELRAPLVVGCDGTPSLVRRALGIGVEREAYDHEFLYIAADGLTDPPGAQHFCLDEQGVVMVSSRPGMRMRIVVRFQLGERGDLLKRPDPALHEYVSHRVPIVAHASFGREDAHVYTLARQLADRYSAPGAALVGDAAHTTHPAGGTGMNLAVAGAAKLAEAIVPVLASSPVSLAALDEALAAFDAERRPAAEQAVEQNHRQAMRIWRKGVEDDPEAYAAAVDPTSDWGVRGAGWGQDPAALSAS